MRRKTGKYIAIVDNRVVSSGENAKEVWRTAKEKVPDKTPSLAKVPREELLALKRAFGELSKRTEKIEPMLSELDEEEAERILERSLKTGELKRVMTPDKVESCQ